MNELEDAQEHLHALISEMTEEKIYEVEAFQVNLAHVMSHLNRAWARRDTTEDLTESEWEIGSQFSDELSHLL